MVKHQHSLCILGSDTCNQTVVAISDLSICINSSQHGVIGIPYGLAVVPRARITIININSLFISL